VRRGVAAHDRGRQAVRQGDPCRRPDPLGAGSARGAPPSTQHGDLPATRAVRGALSLPPGKSCRRAEPRAETEGVPRSAQNCRQRGQGPAREAVPFGFRGSVGRVRQGFGIAPGPYTPLVSPTRRFMEALRSGRDDRPSPRRLPSLERQLAGHSSLVSPPSML
jgi:hypothetical protein